MNNTMTIGTQNNKGQIIGKVVDDNLNSFEVEGENFVEGKLLIDRLSENSDILPFTISEKLLKAGNLTLEKGKVVAFSGEFRSYNRLIDGKSRLILSFFVKDILNIDEIDLKKSNEIALIGYVCKTPVYRTTPFNRQICDVLVAVNRANFNKSDYIPCIMWGRNAKLMQSQKVGTKISIVGRMQSREYKKDLGNGTIETRTAYEVSCQQLEIMDANNFSEKIEA